MTPAHDQTENHKYVVHYPEHLPRADDPHYVYFNEYHKRTHDTATCYIGDRVGTDACSKGPLELHHAHVEFSLANGVDIDAIKKDWPDLTDENAVQNWIESEQNFRWLCMFHHRGHAGAHVAAHADWEAGQYVKDLIS